MRSAPAVSKLSLHTHGAIVRATEQLDHVHGSDGEADRERIVQVYDAMRPNIQLRVDMECFLTYFGPKGRLKGGGRRTDMIAPSVNLFTALTKAILQ